jgi:iron-sulfur cluster assembly accessory protein
VNTITEFISIKPLAIKAIKEILTHRQINEHNLRIFAKGSSCAGIQFGLSLGSSVQSDDMIFEMEEIKVMIDNVSINYARGLVIDYFEDQSGSYFKIINPNPVTPCNQRPSSDENKPLANQGCNGCQ